MSRLVLFLSLVAVATSTATAFAIEKAFEHADDGRLEMEEIVEAVNSAKTTWKAGVNFPKHWTKFDYQSLCGAKPPLTRKHSPSATGVHHLHSGDVTLPKKFDARKKWKYCKALQTVPDQGPCGSSWAINAVSSVTDRLCIATNGTWNGQLSVEDVLSCCSDCGSGCDGGYAIRAWRYMYTYGVVSGGYYNSSQGCQPYEMPTCEHFGNSTARPNCSSFKNATTPQCRRSCYNPKYKGPTYDQDKKFVSAYYDIDNITSAQQNILRNGPIQVSFDVYEDFPNYKSGVYQHVTGGLLGYHTGKVVGWGVEKKTPYWLVANTWNEDWGDKGMFKILRGKDHCSIESYMMAGTPTV